MDKIIWSNQQRASTGAWPALQITARLQIMQIMSTAIREHDVGTFASTRLVCAEIVADDRALIATDENP